MQYELHKFESFIEKYCKGGNIFSDREYSELLNIIDEEQLRIKEAFIKNYFSLKKSQSLKKYVQQHQTAMIKLIDTVFLSMDIPNNVTNTVEVDSKTKVSKHLYKKLEALLSFIESYFQTYFNLDDKIPERYQLIAKHEIDGKITLIQNKITLKKDCSLYLIAISPLEEFSRAERKISFRELIYLKKLLSVIDKSCKTCNHQISKCFLKSKLIYLNFNSYRFFSFLSAQITNIYEEKESLNSQIEVLCYHLKKINQTQEKPGFIYKYDRKSLKDTLAMWLIEEIAFLEKKLQLSFNPGTNISETLPKDFKITTECSVSQVAYLLRLLVDSGAITNKNQREIINFFANNIKTKKADNVSPESLRTKYYNTESSTIEAVKDLIIKMLNKIHNDK